MILPPLTVSGQSIVYPAHTVLLDDVVNRFADALRKLDTFAFPIRDIRIETAPEYALVTFLARGNRPTTIELSTTPTAVFADYRVVISSGASMLGLLICLALLLGVAHSLWGDLDWNAVGWGIPGVLGANYLIAKMGWSFRVEKLLKASIPAKGLT